MFLESLLIFEQAFIFCIAQFVISNACERSLEPA